MYWIHVVGLTCATVQPVTGTKGKGAPVALTPLAAAEEAKAASYATAADKSVVRLRHVTVSAVLRAAQGTATIVIEQRDGLVRASIGAHVVSWTHLQLAPSAAWKADEAHSEAAKALASPDPHSAAAQPGGAAAASERP